MFNRKLKKQISELKEKIKKLKCELALSENEKKNLDEALLESRARLIKENSSLIKEKEFLEEENERLEGELDKMSSVEIENSRLRQAVKDARENADWYHVQYNDVFYQLRQAKDKLSRYEKASESERCRESAVVVVPLGGVDKDAGSECEAEAECES